MKRYIIITGFCIVASFSFSQTVLYSTSYDFPGFYTARLNKIIKTSDFGYFGVINTMKLVDDYYHFGIIAVKFDSDLDTLWTKKIYNVEHFCDDIIQSDDDGYILAGSAYGHFFISKLNNTGDVIFDTLVTTLSTGHAESISLTSDGNYLISGCRSYKMYIQKIDINCNFLCGKFLSDSNGTIFTSVYYNSYNYLVGSYYENNQHYLRLFKLNSALDTIWTKKLNFSCNSGWSIPTQIIHTVDNEFIIGGYQVHTNPDNSFIIKTDSIGNVIWDSNFNNKHLLLRSIIQAGNGGYFIGFYEGGGTNLIRYSKEFFPLWEGFSDDIYTIIRNHKFSYLLAANTCTLINISDNFQSIEENHIGKIINMQVTPNPAESQIILYFTLPYKSNFKCRINIYDVFGQLIDNIIQEGNNGENEYLLDVRNYSTGVYFVRLISDDLKGNCKFLVINW